MLRFAILWALLSCIDKKVEKKHFLVLWYFAFCLSTHSLIRLAVFGAPLSCSAKKGGKKLVPTLRPQLLLPF